MFKTTSTPVIEPAPDVKVSADDPIPLSHLELDLDPPSAGGWTAFLNAKGIEVVVDDLGRKAISRSDARQLFDEHRAAEARKREVLERQERRAVEADRLRRASIWGGVPADHMPPGVAPAAAMLAAAHDERPRRMSVLQEALSNSGELTYHSLAEES
jgi:hypothetical protein